MFEHGFLPLINDHSFRHSPPTPHPPPLDNDRVCDNSAMLAFAQEKISHYTTGPSKVRPKYFNIKKVKS